jgi:hypothetical protein
VNEQDDKTGQATTDDATADVTPGVTPGVTDNVEADVTQEVTHDMTADRDHTPSPGLDLLHETQPVPAGVSTTTAMPAYPTLPAAYTLDDDGPDAADLTTPGGPPNAAVASSAPTAPSTLARTPRTPRVRTVTFGLVILAISVISLVALMTDVRIDGGVVGLGLLIGAGVALVAGGIAAARREARGGPGAVR